MCQFLIFLKMFDKYLLKSVQRLIHYGFKQIFLVFEKEIDRSRGDTGIGADVSKGCPVIAFFQKFPLGTFYQKFSFLIVCVLLHSFTVK